MLLEEVALQKIRERRVFMYIEKFKSEKPSTKGNFEASLIRNEVDREVNIIISDAQAAAAELEAEGEAEYMRLLAEAYNTKDKREFYEFTLALDALKNSLTGSEKVIVLDRDSKLAQILMGY